MQLKWIEGMDMTNNDVIVCAFIKTGSHLTWEIINMIQQGTSTYKKDVKETATLEFLHPKALSSTPSPRVFSMHCTPQFLPIDAIDKRCKIIHVVRNPKDVAVSMYFHVTHRTKILGYSPSFSEFLQAFQGIKGIQHLCSYPWYLNEVNKFKKNSPDFPILDVFYEDIVMQPEKEIKKMASFLGKSLDVNLVKEISKKCQFARMKKANAEFKDDTMLGDCSFFYRKGKVGDWKNHFTVAENESFDQWVHTHFQDSDISFTFE